MKPGTFMLRVLVVGAITAPAIVAGAGVASAVWRLLRRVARTKQPVPSATTRASLAAGTPVTTCGGQPEVSTQPADSQSQ